MDVETYEIRRYDILSAYDYTLEYFRKQRELSDPMEHARFLASLAEVERGVRAQKARQEKKLDAERDLFVIEPEFEELLK